MSGAWNVLQLLQTTADYFTKKGRETARLDSELLLCEVLKLDRVRLYCSFDKPVAQHELDAFRELVRRRGAGEPVAYILGRKEFYGLSFEVGPGVLVPRPETEHVVDQVLALIPKEEQRRVLDVGTGSGAIAVAIARERPKAQVTASDISNEALTFARRNARQHGVEDRIEFMEGDLFADCHGRFHVIVSNPPYIDPAEAGDLPGDVIGFEPQQALFAGERGLEIIRRLIESAPRALVSGGALVMEIGYRQATAVKELAQSFGRFSGILIVRDYADRDRVAVLRFGE
jgi:release factor glutamine methyltransferase